VIFLNRPLPLIGDKKQRWHSFDRSKNCTAIPNLFKVRIAGKIEKVQIDKIFYDCGAEIEIW